VRTRAPPSSFVCRSSNPMTASVPSMERDCEVATDSAAVNVLHREPHAVQHEPHTAQ
jgi:hypothetical protein